MPLQVVSTAKTTCTMSAKPSQRVVLPTRQPTAGGQPAPVQCVPNTVIPWTPGSTVVTLANQPALQQTDICQCVWGGTITITDPGQTIVNDL